MPGALWCQSQTACACGPSRFPPVPVVAFPPAVAKRPRVARRPLPILPIRRRAIKGARLVLTAALALASVIRPAAPANPDYAAESAEMVRVIRDYAPQSGSAVSGGRLAPEVLRVMGTVPRHEFVPERLKAEAYADRPLPIGSGQTISQPFIVALMTDLLHLGKDDAVLEIGTGSGYQAAVLAHLVRRVYTIEIIPALAEAAAERLRRLGYANIETRVGDGYYGWEEAAPFDGIVVTAAATSIPPPLIRQLKPGGRMVIPVGAPFAVQYLTLVELDADRRATTRQLLPVAFVPLTGRR
jgi:protein-L-isoaspartate(D-aspartate) O-methyltransferase